MFNLLLCAFFYVFCLKSKSTKCRTGHKYFTARLKIENRSLRGRKSRSQAVQSTINNQQSTITVIGRHSATPRRQCSPRVSFTVPWVSIVCTCTHKYVIPSTGPVFLGAFVCTVVLYCITPLSYGGSGERNFFLCTGPVCRDPNCTCTCIRGTYCDDT